MSETPDDPKRPDIGEAAETDAVDPNAADPAQGLDAIPFPPKQTTICPLGPSSVAPIVSAIRRFRGEFEAKIPDRTTIPVSAG